MREFWKRILISFLKLGLLAAVPVTAKGEAFAVMSKGLALSNQPGWLLWFSPTDSPEGAYLGTITETKENISGLVPLGKELQPGRYYLSIKVYDYLANGRINVFAGGHQVTFTNLSSQDFNAWWTLPVVVDLPVPASTLTLTLLRTAPLGQRQIYLLKGIYITTAPQRIVDREDRVISLGYPTQMDTTPPSNGNVLANGSFEMGIGHGWGLEEGGSRQFSIQTLWDDTIAYEGRASVKLPRLTDFVSRVHRLKPNKKYTLSAWLKSIHPSTATLTLKNVTAAPFGHPPSVVLTTNVSVNNTWQRFSITGYMLDYPTPDYQFRISGNDPQGVYTWIDAVQLEEGDLSDYSPDIPLEVGLVTGMPSNLFFEDQPALADLLVANTTSSNASATISFEIYDYFNRKVKSGAVNVSVPARTRTEQSLDLSTGRRGIFRVVLWVNGIDRTMEEVSYSILPRPQQMDLDPTSSIGTHSDFADFQLEVLRRMGIKWNRTTSPSRAFRWTTVEPQEGQYLWFDGEINKAAPYGMSILGTLGQETPAWAKTNGLPKLDKWETYVANIVRHYKDRVKYWEIWNEPNFVFTPQFYGELLKAATRAIRQEDPAAKILGFGGVASQSWCRQVLEYLGTNSWQTFMDLGATHIYPKSATPTYDDFSKNIISRFSLELWNTEAGVWDLGFYKGLNSDFVQAEDYVWPHSDSKRYQDGVRSSTELLAHSFLHSIGSGISKYFYYDSRIYIGPSYFKTHSTFFEYDETIRAKGVAYAILAHLFDHSKGLGNLSPWSHTYLYHFDRGGTPMAALWATDGTNRALTLSASPSQFLAYDVMGNPLNSVGSVIPYGPSPVYLEARNITAAAFKSSLQAAISTGRADTNPPALSLLVFPTGPTLQNPLKFRWLAVDEISLPWEGAPDAIQYAYKLEGYETQWSPWSARSFVDYSTLATGAYVFFVKARDEAGNESVALRHPFQIGTVATPMPDLDGDGVPDAQDECPAIAGAPPSGCPPANLDSDSDGLPDDWEQSYFGSLTHNALEDTDGDGRNNLQEFLDGTSPMDSTSVLRPLTVHYLDSVAELVFGFTSNRLYRIEWSDDLLRWQTISNPVLSFPAPATALWRDTNAPGRHRFYRVSSN